jgi:hypothetical protein
VNYSEQLPSKQWAGLMFRGAKFAEVWFKPEGEPLALQFRIPQSSFQIPGIGQRLTIGNLLTADRPAFELTTPLPQPPPDVAHLEIHVRLKPPARAQAHEASSEPEAALAEWHDLEARWKTVLGLEATVDTLRINMEGLRAELDAAMRRTVPADEKVHALAADVAQWNKAKSRAHYALPKASEFIHRATWAAGTPERKRLGELFKNPIATQSDLPRAEEVLQEIEFLRKDRQVLSAQGVTVYQECKTISADVQAALRRLQSNAAVRASKKKGGTGAKGKSY